MTTALRYLGVVLLLTVLLSLAGAGELLGLIVTGAVLVAILALALAGLRPQRQGRDTHAHKPNYFQRYGGFDATSLPMAIVAGAAIGRVASHFGGETLGGYLGAGIVACGAFAVSAPIASAVAGVAGGVAATFAFFADGACGEVASSEAVLMFAVVVAIAVVSFVGVQALLFAPRSLIPLPLPKRTEHGFHVLALGGVIELAAMVAQPAGLDIWPEAGGEARLLAIVLLAVIAVLGAYGPELVLALVAIALVALDLYWIGWTLESNPGLCVAPTDLAFLAVATAGAWAGASLRPRGRS